MSTRIRPPRRTAGSSPDPAAPVGLVQADASSFAASATEIVGGSSFTSTTVSLLASSRGKNRPSMSLEQPTVTGRLWTGGLEAARSALAVPLWDDAALMVRYTADARTRLTPEQLTALADRKGMPLAVYIRTVLLEHLEHERERNRPGNMEGERIRGGRKRRQRQDSRSRCAPSRAPAVGPQSARGSRGARGHRLPGGPRPRRRQPRHGLQVGARREGHQSGLLQVDVHPLRRDPRGAGPPTAPTLHLPTPIGGDEEMDRRQLLAIPAPVEVGDHGLGMVDHDLVEAGALPERPRESFPGLGGGEAHSQQGRGRQARPRRRRGPPRRLRSSRHHHQHLLVERRGRNPPTSSSSP